MPRSRDRDRLHLLHMRDAAQHSQHFIENRSRDDLDNDHIFQLALAKAVELVGESASQISDELRTQNSHIPCKKLSVCGMYWCITTGESRWM